MFFKRKKAKPIDMSFLDEGEPAAVDFSAVGDFGPSVPLGDIPEPPDDSPQSWFATWKAMGEAAWKVLLRQRIADLFPGCDDIEQCSEFLLYWDLIRRSSRRFRDEVFIGLGPPPGPPVPIFVPRSTFDGHAYILGKPARGKTSQALTNLLLQIATPIATPDEQDQDPPAAVLIIDLKPQGDRFLRGVAELLARSRGQELRFFSNTHRYDSLLFDPWRVIASQPDVQAQAETIFKSLSLIHPESQDAVFFMNEQRTVLEGALVKRPQSLRQLIDDLEKMTRGRDGNREARGVHGALSIFENATNVIVDAGPPRPNAIDFRAFLDRREVLYVHLESDEKHLSSQATGKLILSCLLTAAKQRREDEGLDSAKVYVAIDEFHRLAAQNVVSFLETSRDLGVSFILSHQSPESLRSKSDDLFRLLFDIVGFQQYLTLTNPQAIELIRLASSRRSEFLRQMNRSTAHGRGTSIGWNKQHSDTDTGTYGFLWGRWGADRWGTSDSVGSSGSVTENITEQEGSGESEAKIPGLTPEMVAQVNAPAGRVSLIVSWGEHDSSLTPLAGIPTLVSRLFPFSKKLADRLRKDVWPLRSKPASQPNGRTVPHYLPLLSDGAKAAGPDAVQENLADLWKENGRAGGKRSRAAGGKKKPKKTKGPEEPSV